MLLLSGACASSVGAGVREECWKFFPALSSDHRLVASEPQATNVIGAKLAPSIHRFYHEDPDLAAHMGAPPLRAGHSIATAGKTYQVIQILGNGTQGDVYLARSGAESFSVKIFHNMHVMKSSLHLNQELAERGVPILRPIHVDQDAGIWVLPFKRGVTVQNLRLHYKELGLTTQEWNALETRLHVFVASVTQKAGQLIPEGVEEMNILYDVDTDEFLLLDAN